MILEAKQAGWLDAAVVVHLSVNVRQFAGRFLHAAVPAGGLLFMVGLQAWEGSTVPAAARGCALPDPSCAAGIRTCTMLCRRECRQLFGNDNSCKRASSSNSVCRELVTKDYNLRGQGTVLSCSSSAGTTTCCQMNKAELWLYSATPAAEESSSTGAQVMGMLVAE